MEVVEETAKVKSEQQPPTEEKMESTSEEKTSQEPVEVIEARDPTTRPAYRLSVKLIDTYKHINKIYYEAKAKKLRDQQSGTTRGGVYNDGYDDQNYDYIIHGDEIFAERYILKHRIGKVWYSALLSNVSLCVVLGVFWASRVCLWSSNPKRCGHQNYKIKACIYGAGQNWNSSVRINFGER